MPDLKEKNRIILKNSKMHELWDLGAPTILEQALQTIVAYVDTAMVGQIGAIASAAVGLTTTVNWLLNGILFAVSMGMLSFIAQYTGQGDLEAAHHTSAQAIWIIFVLGVIETVIALAISPVLPMWMGASQEIWRDASEYFFIVNCPLILRGSLIIFGNVLRANKDSKTPLYINIGVNFLNIILNQLLISSHTTISVFGMLLSIPGAGLGVRGAAIATAISQGIGGVTIFWVAMQNPLVTLKGMKVKPEGKLLKNCFNVSLPLIGERIVVGCGDVVFSALVAGLGTLSVAAHSIALTIEQAFYVPGYGIQTAVSTLAGNAVGKKDELELESVVRSGLIVAVSIMTAMAIGLFCGAEVIIRFFTKDEQVIVLGVSLLRIVAISEPMYAALIIYEGIFHDEFTTSNDALNKLYPLINKNVWIEYFSECPSYIGENWIDFETEISRVIQTIDVARDYIVQHKDIMDIPRDMQGILMGIIKKSKGNLKDICGSIEHIDRFTGRLYKDLKSLVRALEIPYRVC